MFISALRRAADGGGRRNRAALAIYMNLKLAKNLTTWARFCAVNDQDAAGFLQALQNLRRLSPFELNPRLWRIAETACDNDLATGDLCVMLLQQSAECEKPKPLRKA